MNPTRPYPSWACRTAIGPVPVLGGRWRNICVLVARLWLPVQYLRAVASQQLCKSSSMSSPMQSICINIGSSLSTARPAVTQGSGSQVPGTSGSSLPSARPAVTQGSGIQAPGTSGSSVPLHGQLRHRPAAARPLEPVGGGSGGAVVASTSLPVSVPDVGPDPMAMAVLPCSGEGAHAVARGLAAADLSYSWLCRSKGAHTGSRRLAAAALCPAGRAVGREIPLMPRAWLPLPLCHS